MKNFHEIETAEVANEDSLTPAQILTVPQDRGDSNRSEGIYAANESRYIEATFSEPLTAVAVGYQDPGQLQELLDFMCPVVPTSRRSIFTCLARARPRLPGGTSLVMVEPAPIFAPAPTFTGATRLTLEPIKTFSPMTVLCLFFPS